MANSAIFSAAAFGVRPPLMSLLVMPCIWAPTIPLPASTKLLQRSVILPPLIFTAATSTRSEIFASRPVVSVSTITKVPPFAAASANASTLSVLGSIYGTRFSLPTLARSSSCRATSALIAPCPNSMASAILSSVIRFAPASTIMIALTVPETTKSRSLSLSCSKVGLMTKAPFTMPTRTAPIGPRNGISEIVSAAEAASVPRMSGSFSWSALSTVITTCTSSLYPSGKSGRIGRSVRRAESVAFSEARPSRLMYPPGIFPAAYMRSSNSIVSGKKSRPGRGSLRFAVPRTTVSP